MWFSIWGVAERACVWTYCQNVWTLVATASSKTVNKGKNRIMSLIPGQLTLVSPGPTATQTSHEWWDLAVVDWWCLLVYIVIKLNNILYALLVQWWSVLFSSHVTSVMVLGFESLDFIFAYKLFSFFFSTGQQCISYLVYILLGPGGAFGNYY